MHLLSNLLKQQQHKNILEEKQDINRHYTALISLQQQVVQQLRQARSVQELQWVDLSKATFLADELIRGIRAPSIEFDYRVEHPLLEQNPEQTYQALFIAGGGDPLPMSLQAIKDARSEREELIYSFTKVAAQRKAYAAVAFQYLSADLTQKAIEMNAVLKQSQRFSMTEAERLQLQADSDELLERAAQMLERYDQLLLEVAQTPVVRRQSLDQ